MEQSVGGRGEERNGDAVMENRIVRGLCRWRTGDGEQEHHARFVRSSYVPRTRSGPRTYEEATSSVSSGRSSPCRGPHLPTVVFITRRPRSFVIPADTSTSIATRQRASGSGD